MLAGDYYHSVRDEMTKDRLNAMGFKMSLILVVPPRGRLRKLTAEIYQDHRLPPLYGL